MKYQIFEPGKYFDWEKEIIEERLAIAQKDPPKGSSEPPETISEYELLMFNRNWNAYNPLFNNKEYAQKAGYQDVPAFPCFKIPQSNVRMTVPERIDADLWYYAHGPEDAEFLAPIFPGDTLHSETEKLMFEELTVPGSDLRYFKGGAIVRLYNQKDDLVVRRTYWLRNAYRKIIDGSYVNRDVDLLVKQPPVHYTTDEEWEYIKELWNNEYIRGKDTLYWEDVKVGDEPTWTCSGPVSHLDMARCYGYQLFSTRDFIMNPNPDPDMDLSVVSFKDPFGQYLVGIPQMFGGRNLPSRRAHFRNDTGAIHIARMLTNYIGDAGSLTRLGWFFHQHYPEMRYPREGGEYLDQVPYMKGKACSDHGMEGDTVIAKGYVTDKYINDKGEHIIKLVCWGETLDRRIIQVAPAEAKLPSKKK